MTKQMQHVWVAHSKWAPSSSFQLSGLEIGIYNFVPLLYIHTKPQPTSSISHIPMLNLRQKIPRRMPNMIIRKRRHREITMIVPILPSHIHFPLPLSRLDEVLGQELSLFVEIVACALFIPTRIVS